MKPVYTIGFNSNVINQYIDHDTLISDLFSYKIITITWFYVHVCIVNEILNIIFIVSHLKTIFFTPMMLIKKHCKVTKYILCEVLHILTMGHG